MSTPKTSAKVPKLRFLGFEGVWSCEATTGLLCELIVDCVNKTAPIVEDETPFKMLRTTNIRNGRIDLSYCRRVTRETFETWTRRAKVERGDVILTREAPIGEVGYVDFDDTVFLGQRLMQYRVNSSKLNPRYLLYSFLSPSLRGQFAAHDGTGSTVSHIRVGDCSRFTVAHPTLPEQHKIAEFLTAVDGRIGQLSQKKALLEDYKKGVMQQLFTQALRFKDDHGNDFPDWEEAEFGKIAKRSSEKHNPMTSATEYPSVELESLSQGSGQLLQLFVSTDQKSIKSKFTKGDVLFGKLRPYLRKWLMPAFDGVCSSEIWVLRGKTVTNAYLYHLIQTGEFMKATNVSSGSKMPRADWDHIAAVTFSYPTSSEEQTKIASFLTALDRKIESVSSQIRHTQAFKKGLLQQMFV